MLALLQKLQDENADLTDAEAQKLTGYLDGFALTGHEKHFHAALRFIPAAWQTGTHFFSELLMNVLHGGNMNLIRHVATMVPDQKVWQEVIKSAAMNGLRCAGKFGQVEPLQWLVSEIQKTQPPEFLESFYKSKDASDLFRDLCEIGDTAKAAYLYSEIESVMGPELLHKAYSLIVETAFQRGRFETFKWLYEKICRDLPADCGSKALSINQLAYCGSTATADFLYNKAQELYGDGTPRLCLSFNNYQPFRDAIYIRNAHMQEWLLDKAFEAGGHDMRRDMVLSLERVDPAHVNDRGQLKDTACMISDALHWGDDKTFQLLFRELENYGEHDLCRKLISDPKDFYLCLNLKGTRPLLETIKNVACRIGAADLLHDHIDFAIRHIDMLATGQNGDSMFFLLYNCSEEQRQFMMEKLPPEWKNLRHNRPYGPALQNLWVLGNTRWQMSLKQDLPEGLGYHDSPWGFKPALFNELLPLMKTACQLEGNNGYSEGRVTYIAYAYKLAVLFSNKEAVDQYLKQNWNNEGQPVHDACLFDIPHGGVWNVKKWELLTKQYGIEASRFVRLAPRIEEYAQTHQLSFPENPEEILNIAKRLAYFDSEKNIEWSALAARSGLSHSSFDTGLKILEKRKKTTDLLPNIFIDGKDINLPKFYMQRLAPDDMRGFVLGEFTNCCQSLGGNGEDCAIHGMTQDISGFYVWKQKTDGLITPDDRIVAESWVWLDSDHNIVFDSYDRPNAGFNRLAQPFLEQFSFDLKRLDIKGAVHLGTGGHTPKGLPFNLAANPSRLPEDRAVKYRDGYEGDSVAQYVVPPVNHREEKPSLHS